MTGTRFAIGDAITGFRGAWVGVAVDISGDMVTFVRVSVRGNVATNVRERWTLMHLQTARDCGWPIK